ncbi:MAG: hypothetical protein ABI742_01375 [Gemmatimonadota bacterium]
MSDSLSRREWLTLVGAAGTAGAVPSLPAPKPSPQPISAAPVLALDSTSDVVLPPPGRSFQKFSFGFPEPSIEVAGFRFGFLVFTRENCYGLDLRLMSVESSADGATLTATGLVWAGGQERSSGNVVVRFRTSEGEIRWEISAEMDQPIKSVTTVIRGLPHGRISGGGGPAFNPGQDELLFGYPFRAGDLFGDNAAAGLGTPLLSIVRDETTCWSLASLDDRVRPKRFYLQPTADGYRTEAVFEAEGWTDRRRIEVPAWRLWRSDSLDAAATAHYAHLERAYGLTSFATRPDAPKWLAEIALVLSLHGAHFTGYLFNDFGRMLEILRWVAERIPPRRVLVFLPAWDGRYYWNYPLYQADPRMGGDTGFRHLLEEGRRLGFRFMPMFGANCANRRHPEFAKFADAATSRIDGDRFDLTWVDWDNDRHQDGWLSYMNLGVVSWRNWLTERIAEVIDRYEVDAYFLDIAGGWVNNPQADMHQGIRRLIAELRARHPAVLACGEFHYDALLAVMPLFHVYSPRAARYVRAFSHLSHPAPGRGSSGVHESGFGGYDTATHGVGPGPIPTITVVDDTFTQHRDEMAAIITRARELARL